MTGDASGASTDWEYGHSPSHSHENDVSSLSDWQMASEMTRTEREYKKRSKCLMFKIANNKGDND